MPLTKAYLDLVVESVEDYQIRRVQWAVETLHHQGEQVEPWKVIRLAGLRPGYSEKVERAIVYGVCRPIYRITSCAGEAKMGPR